MNVRFAFLDPVAAGESGVEDAVFDVARHFLGTDEHALGVGDVDGGKIRSASGGDVIAGAAEKDYRGVFQAYFRDAEFELHCLLP